MLGKIFPKDYISASTCTGYLHLFMPMYSTRYYFIILSPDAANILRLIFNLSIYLFLDVSHPSCVLFLLFTEKSCTETNFQIKNVKIPPPKIWGHFCLHFYQFRVQLQKPPPIYTFPLVYLCTTINTFLRAKQNKRATETVGIADQFSNQILENVANSSAGSCSQL